MENRLPTLPVLPVPGTWAIAGPGPQIAVIPGAHAVQPHTVGIAAFDMAALSAPCADDFVMQRAGIRR